VQLLKYAGGSDAHEDTSVVADVPIEPSGRGAGFWTSDRNYPENPGRLRVGLFTGPAGPGADTYELVAEASEVGLLVGAMKPKDVEPFVGGFLARATPAVVGAVVGQVVAHLLRAAAERPAKRGKR
jgi:hypothetical protein